jgi:hypothetical protein
MTLFNLVHFLSRYAGPSRRWGGLMGLVAALLFPLSTPGFAQGASWGKWVEPALGSDKGIPPGVGYPGGQPLCEGMQLSGKHAYWRCFPRCNGESGGWCWEGVSDAIYTCPAPAKGFRRMEKIRYTNVPCGPKDWQQTKHLAEIYEETWITKITETPPELTTPSPPPTTEAELPPQTGDTPSQWDGGGPPWAPKEAEKTDDGKTDTGKTDTGKTDTGKTDTAKTDTGKTDTGTDKKDAATDKKVTGGSGTTTPSNTKKSAPRKEVRNKSGGRTVDRSRGGNDIDQGGLSPEAATAIGIGIGMGLGAGFGRGHMGGDRMGGDRRMMDR